MLKISKRRCVLGDTASTKGKTDEEDGAKTRTLTFEVEELMLTARELNALLGEPHAHDVLYNTTPDGPIPYLKSLKALELRDSADGASVELTYGLQAKVFAFAGCKLSGIKLELRDGGETALSCKVTATPTLDETLAELFTQFGKPIDCEIRADLKSDQKDLPLNRFGIGEQKGKPKRGRGSRRGNGERPRAN